MSSGLGLPGPNSSPGLPPATAHSHDTPPVQQVMPVGSLSNFLEEEESQAGHDWSGCWEGCDLDPHDFRKPLQSLTWAMGDGATTAPTALWDTYPTRTYSQP